MKSPTPFTFRQRSLPLLLSLIGCALLVTALLMLNQPQLVAANSTDMANAVAKYPAINGSRLDACALCHTSQVPALNPFGTDYKNNGRNVAAFGAIESKDSDKDGFTNLQEIQALSFPGNPNDVPQATPMPTPTVGTVLSIHLFLPMIVQ